VRLFAAVVEASIPAYPQLPPSDTEIVNRYVLEAVTRHFRSAPRQIRLAIGVILWVFAAYCLVSKRRSLQASTSAERSAMLTAFSRCTPTYFSALERLVRSATVLAYFEHPTVLTAAGYETIADRQRARRRLRGT
jgi:hypothetical protein